MILIISHCKSTFYTKNMTRLPWIACITRHVMSNSDGIVVRFTFCGSLQIIETSLCWFQKKEMVVYYLVQKYSVQCNLFGLFNSWYQNKDIPDIPLESNIMDKFLKNLSYVLTVPSKELYVSKTYKKRITKTFF